MSRDDRGNVNSNSSGRPAYVGGNYNRNANYGFFYVNANNAASNSNANLGSRLLFYKGFTPLRTQFPAAWRKCTNRAGFSRIGNNFERP